MTFNIQQRISVAYYVIAYSLTAFSLLNFSFFLKFVNYSPIDYSILLGIPFVGRMLTPILYPISVRQLGMARVLSISTAISGLISVAEEFTVENFPVVLIERFIIGVMFGLSLSSAVELASFERSKTITGLTLSGWAIGFLIAALSYEILGKWMLLTGILAIPMIFIKGRRYGINTFSKINLAFSLKGFIMSFLAFEPAYALTLVPLMINDSFEESIIAYSIAIIAYIILPKVESYFKELVIAIGVLGAISFLTLSVPIISIFTALGLGFISIIPSIAYKKGISPRDLGPSMNLASIGGLIFPTVIEIAHPNLTASILTIALMLILASF
ncbi:MAG: hypothetical protein OWQ54_06865 [Sulfolobaceae archaeon]|nr:hypothetical protein [Sulfolobaceae archaeon]